MVSSFSVSDFGEVDVAVLWLASGRNAALVIKVRS